MSLLYIGVDIGCLYSVPSDPMAFLTDKTSLSERSRQKILGHSSRFSRRRGEEQEDRDVDQQAGEGRRVHCL